MKAAAAALREKDEGAKRATRRTDEGRRSLISYYRYGQFVQATLVEWERRYQLVEIRPLEDDAQCGCVLELLGAA